MALDERTSTFSTGDRNEQWRLFFEQSEGQGFFLLDSEGLITAWPESAAKITGHLEHEMLGARLAVLHPPEDVAANIPEQLLETARKQGRCESEGVRLRRSGESFWAHVVITGIRDAAGCVRSFAGVIRDASARRVREEELRRSEQRFRLLVGQVRDYAIFMLDPEGRIATWNQGAQTIKGYSAEDVIGTHFSRFYTAEDLAVDKPGHELEVARREGRIEDEGWRLRKDGTRFWANVVITALRDRTGTLLGFGKVTRDLTTRREAEEQLRTSEERFRMLVEAVTDYAIYMLDPTGYVTTWNAGAEKLTFYSASEVIGKHLSIFFQEEDVRAGKPERELELAAQQGRFEEESYRTRKDGTKFWANVVLTPIRDAKGTLLGFTKVTRDLTARLFAENTARELVREQAARAAAEEAEATIRQAARRAEDAARKAEEANRIKDEFLATVSHELRTPLNAIVGWASMLRSRNTEPSFAKGLEVIHRNAVTQSRIIEDILDVSRIITGKLHLDVKPTDVIAIVHEAMDVVRASANAKNLSLQIVGSAPSGALYADPERLRQIVWNLLSNSVKFTEPGGRIDVEVGGSASELVLSVKDTGRGIDPSFLRFVFDRFVQEDSSATRRVGGLGLGLAIVRHLVELHGGRVEAESAGLGLGATFRVFLPLRTTQTFRTPDAESPTSEEHPIPTGILAGQKVLVVDDDADGRELVATVLLAAGAVVETAGSAEEGFALLQRFDPDVLISDIGMPGEDGYAFIQRVSSFYASRDRSLCSVALSAYTREQDKNKAIAMGFTTHLSKPVDPDDLVDLLVGLHAGAQR